MNREDVVKELIDLVNNGCNGKQCHDCLLHDPALQYFCDMIAG